jgi:hypothetical protein
MLPFAYLIGHAAQTSSRGFIHSNASHHSSASAKNTRTPAIVLASSSYSAAYARTRDSSSCRFSSSAGTGVGRAALSGLLLPPVYAELTGDHFFRFVSHR